ncbi:MAG: creatininase family protein [Thermomicrobiales bacterium]
MDKVRTAEMSWREVEAAIGRGAAVLVPMGSTEEHGPHAPTGDYLIADEITARVAQTTGAVMTPTIPFSYSEYFRRFPGTITLQAETLRLLVRDTVYCLLDQGFRHVILVNGHKGNEPILLPLIRQIRRERGVLTPVVAPLGFGLTGAVQRDLYGDTPIGHGGEPIGSLMSHLHPELVDLDRAEAWESKPYLGLPTSGLNGVLFEGRPVNLAINMEEITPPSGSLSDPYVASAAKGERIVEEAVTSLADFVRWFIGVDPAVEP